MVVFVDDNKIPIQIVVQKDKNEKLEKQNHEQSVENSEAIF